MPPKQPADAAKAPKVKGVAKTKDALVADKKAAIKDHKALFNSAPKSFAIGNCVQPVRNLSRYVKWPKYVRLQRQRSILYDRLKTPPSIAQFTRTLDKASAAELFKMLDKYVAPCFSQCDKAAIVA
jgi:large subunit ribosomal protein L7Ae